MTRVLSVWAFALAPLLGASLASAEPRVALVIGNADYGADMGRLANPVNDAALMEQSLKVAGFEVIAINDADQTAMMQAIGAFGKRLAASGPDVTALFYYSGHGLQVDGENYLVPVNAHITAVADVDLQAISADTILKQMQFADARVNIIILDACRNNPLPRGTKSMQSGLARIEAPRGSFVAYSTAPGEVATDGMGKNSPYTEALAAAITTPGLSIEEAFRNVRGSVLTETGNNQTPWESSSLTAPFFFTPVVAGGAPLTVPPIANGGTRDPRDVESEFWNSVKDSKDPADFTAYLEQYPQGNFVRLAKNRLALLAPPAPAPVIPAPIAPAPAVEAAPEESPAAASAAVEALTDPDAAADICRSEDAAAEARLSACPVALSKGGLDTATQADFTNEIGRAQYELSNYADAVTAYRKAIELNPTEPAYPANLALALSDDGDYAAAIIAYDQAVAVDPKNVWNFYNRGFAYLNSGAADKAGVDLDRALAIDENFDLLAARGFISLAEGKEKEAIAFTSRALALSGDRSSLQSIAILYLAERDKEAIAMADRLIKDDQGYGYGQIWKALLLTRQGKSGAARTLLAKTLEGHGEDWPGMLMRWMLGKYDDETLLTKAREGTRDDVRNQMCEANFYLGLQHDGKGETEAAQAFFTDALATKVYHYIEYHLAAAYLRRLKGGE